MTRGAQRAMAMAGGVIFASLVASERAALAQGYAPPTPYNAPAPFPGTAPPVYGQPAYGQPMYGQPAPQPQYGAPNAYGQGGSTSAQLASAERSDSGRGLEVAYLQAAVGGAYSGLDTLASSHLGLNKVSEGGPTFGLAGGARLLFFTIGARARLDVLPDYGMMHLDLDLGYHVPIGAWDPYVSIHGGYAFEISPGSGQVPASTGAGASFSSLAASQVALHGVEVGVSGGADYYLTPLVSLGVDATAELLFLSRPQVSPTDDVTRAAAPDSLLYQRSGSADGIGISGSLHAGVHFSL